MRSTLDHVPHDTDGFYEFTTASNDIYIVRREQIEGVSIMLPLVTLTHDNPLTSPTSSIVALHLVAGEYIELDAKWWSGIMTKFVADVFEQVLTS